MNGYKVADWIEKAPYSEYDSAKLAIITLKELQKENDEMLKGIKDIYKWLESTCPDGFADETFRCLPVSILRKAQEKSSDTYCKHGFDMNKCKCPKCEAGIY